MMNQNSSDLKGERILTSFEGINYINIKTPSTKTKEKDLKLVVTNKRLLFIKSNVKDQNFTAFLGQDNSPYIKSKVPLGNLDDIIFPSLHKAKKKKKFAIKISLKSKGCSFIVGLTEDCFFALRDYSKESLSYPKSNSEVNHEYSEETKERVKLLARKPELASLYQDLVVKSKCISHDEFFKDLIGNEERKKQALVNQKSTVNESFKSLNQMNLEIGAEIIYMDQETKLELLENFPDLRKEFNQRFLAKFGDRKEEEAKFWDDFWKRQRDKKTILYGGFSEDDKEYRVQMPSLSDELDRKYDLSVNKIYEEIENINILEKDDNLLENFTLPMAVKSQKRGNSITELLNNHSKIIQSKEANLIKKVQETDAELKDQERQEMMMLKLKQEARAEKERMLKSSSDINRGKMVEEKLNGKTHAPESSYKESQVEKFNLYWEEFKQERRRRRNKGFNSFSLFDINRPENETARKRIEAQIKRYENREVTGNEYSQSFKERLDFITKKIYTTNKLFYSKFPLRTDDDEGTKSVRGIVNQLKILKQDVESLIMGNIEKSSDEVEVKKLKGLHKTLIGMIEWSRNKVKRRN